MVGKLVVCHGLPGSGKSSWAREQVGDNVLVVNRDDIRTELFGDSYHLRTPDKSSEVEVTNLQHERIRTGLSAGKTVISDDTNLNLRFLGGLFALADGSGAQVEQKYFDVDVDECKRRNKERASKGGRFVPEHIIDSLAKKSYAPAIVSDNGEVLKPPALKRFVSNGDGTFRTVADTRGSFAVERFNKDLALLHPFKGNGVVILDADGTLFNNSDDARRFLHEPKRKDFHGFFSSIVDAQVNTDVLNLVRKMKENDGLNIVLLTGRSDDYAEHLILALKRSGVPISRLVMKREGDYRPAYLHKQDVVTSLRTEGFALVNAFDDNPKDIAMFERNGVSVSKVGGGLSESGLPKIETLYGSGFCIRCGSRLKDGGNIGPVCATKV